MSESLTLNRTEQNRTEQNRTEAPYKALKALQCPQRPHKDFKAQHMHHKNYFMAEGGSGHFVAELAEGVWDGMGTN